MSDLFLNGNYEVEVGGDGDIKRADGIDYAKQAVAVHVVDELNDHVGDVSEPDVFITSRIESRLSTASLPFEVESLQIETVSDEKQSYNVTISTPDGEFGFGVDV